MSQKELAINQIKHFLSDCQTLNITINKAILFGSFAKGNPNENSDIDVALFSDSFTDNILTNLDLIGKLCIRYPDLDIRTYPTSDLLKDSIMLHQIKVYGIEV